MEFFIVENEIVFFNKNSRYVGENLIVRDNFTDEEADSTYPFSADIIPTISEQPGDHHLFNQAFCEKLKALLLESGSGRPGGAPGMVAGREGPSRAKMQKLSGGAAGGKEVKVEGPSVELDLRASVCLKSRNSYGDSKREWIRVTGKAGPGNFLERLESLLERYGLAIKLKVEITDLNFRSAGGTKVVLSSKMVTDEVSIATLSSSGRNIQGEGQNGVEGPDAGAQLYCSGNWNREKWAEPANGGADSFGRCRLTIKTIIYGDQWQSLLTTGQDTILQRILKEEICSDVVIKTKNGGEVKCHRSILSAHSPVLEAMFRRQFQFKEAQTGRVEMEDISESGVRAFVDYLYFGSLEAPTGDPLIALELLRAADKYNVSSLEEFMVAMLKTKSDEWLGAEGALQLFSFVRALPEETGKVLKMRALNAVKRNYGTLKQLPSFHALFVENPDAVKEILEFAVSTPLEYPYFLLMDNN